jgi:hypothetical protein
VFTKWGDLADALNCTNASGTYTLSPSFSMDGYRRENIRSGPPGYIQITGNVSILGEGAVLDNTENGQFTSFFKNMGTLSLDSMTLKGGHDDGTVSAKCAVLRVMLRVPGVILFVTANSCADFALCIIVLCGLRVPRRRGAIGGGIAFGACSHV